MLRAALRPAAVAARSIRPASSNVARALSTTTARRSGAPAPQIFGEGAKPGEVPTDLNQSTGLERLQLLGEVEGVDVFDYKALDSSRIGTKADPVKVFSWVRQPDCVLSAPDLTSLFSRNPNAPLVAPVLQLNPMSSCG